MQGPPAGSDADRAAAERDRNRTALRDLHARNQQALNAEEAMRRQAEEVRVKLAAYDAEMNRMRGEFSNITGRLEREKQDLQGKYQRTLDESNTAKRQFDDLRTQFQRLQQEWSGTKGESSAAKRTLAEQERRIADLSGAPKSVLHAASQVARDMVAELRSELEKRGVLAQQRPEEEKSEDAPVSVGSLFLGEDVFSARLLIRLGYLRQELEGRGKDDSEHEEGPEYRRGLVENTSIRTFRRSESDEEDGALDASYFSHVTGLWEPEFTEEEDLHGHRSITIGWVTVCLLTLLVEVLVLVVLLLAGMGSSCLEPENAFPALQWWLLHVSKFIAMFTAGVLLGKDLMDCLNYWLVSALLEPTGSYEVAVTAVTRFMVNILIVVVQAKMYTDLADAGSVWLGMSALGFIGSLNSQVLDIAKSGAFGHHIAKTMTSMNYQLDFLMNYPDWFPRSRILVILISSVFVAASSAYTLIVPDYMCQEHDS